MKRGISWDRYGSRYTALDRDLDERRDRSVSVDFCVICRRRNPCRFHDEAAQAEALRSPDY